MGESIATLQKLMEQDGSYLEQVLVDPITEIAIKNNSVELRKYLSKHLPRLLKLAFKENNNEVTLKAVKILTLGSQFVITNLIKTTYFSEFVKKYISKGNLSQRIIGRICDITISILRSGSKDAIKDCDFILQLLNDYCDNLNVYNMFSIIFSEKDKIDYHREWLFETGFDKQLADLLQNYLKKSYSSDYSNDYEGIISLLRIVADASRRRKMREIFLNGAVCDILNQKYDLPPLILNYYWEAVNHLYDAKHSSAFNNLIESAKNVIISKNINIVHRYHAEALNFLSKVIDFNTQFVNEIFIKSIINIMLLYSNSSDFLCESRNFFKKCLAIKDLQDIVITSVSPVMICEAENKTHGLISMFAFAIIADIAETKDTEKLLKKIHGASNFMKTKLKQYLQIINNDYGGDNKSQEQIIITQKTSVWDTPYPCLY